MREFRKISTESIEQYMHIYLNAYPAYKTLDQEGREGYRKKVLTDMRQDRDVDFIGLFEEETLLAIMKVVYFSMNVYGKKLKANGLMSLAVHPLYKKQKIAYDMVQYFETYSKEKGVNILALLPFDISFYRNMGYGLGGKMDQYHIYTKNLNKYPEQSCLSFVHIGQRQEILDCHARICQETHGMFDKFDEEKRAILEDYETNYIGYYENGLLSSYAGYRFESSHKDNYTQTRIVVDELVYKKAEQVQAILGFFRNQADLAQTIVLNSGDQDFYHLIHNPQNVDKGYIPFGYLKTNVSAMANMYKIQDIGDFISSTSHRRFPPSNLVLKIKAYNEITKKVEETRVEFIQTEARSSSWTLTDKKEDLILWAKKGDLSALLLNSLSLSSMVGLGIGEISDPKYLNELDALFYYPQRPYTNSDY